ncbi:hypothetical protein EPJ64_01825 [Brachyspira aalborgi]|uniref:hypothetical protein n=1 Tax=Brachyspira aalborgi TaxID=29522 RepID=UPI0011C96FFF|nr:hypothetical protein [Brachyspira aalborgi]TXJ16998.1 hypothetical protein EPJ77_01050 [Brachyspira aalborgi]TXJ22392.1 hypothetical protein EPJ64_01825 [Brachyspira aalborgi]
MIKKILIIISVSMLALACKSNTGSSGKPVTKNIPSVNHTVKQGSLSLNASKTALFSMTASSNLAATTTSTTDITTITPAADTATNNSKAENERVYSVLTRLYSTVWFQTEEEQDDGKVETESTFLYFNGDSKVEERELETGEPDESEYSIVEIVEGIKLVTSQNNDANRDRNACVVKNTELGDNDSEYQLYYLKDENTLYVIELTEKYTKTNELQNRAESIIRELEGNDASKYNKDKYALSTI